MVIDQVPDVVEVGLKPSAIVYVPLVTVFAPALSLTYTLSEKLIEVSVGYLIITVVEKVPKTKIKVCTVTAIDCVTAVNGELAGTLATIVFAPMDEQ